MMTSTSKSYTVISKEEFSSLFAFGEIPFSSKRTILQDEKDNDLEIKILEVFNSLPTFRGDESYLILEIDVVEDEYISIDQVINIYCLTKASSKSFQLKFDSRIKFNNPLTQTLFSRIEHQHLFQSHTAGIRALTKITNIDYQENILTDEQIKMFIECRSEGLGSDQNQQDYLAQILLYDRYDPFPKTNWGYFYDAALAFVHSKGGTTIKGKPFEVFLNKNNEFASKEPLIELIDLFVQSEETKKIRKMTKSGTIQQFIVAVLYLYLKDDFQSQEIIDKTRFDIFAKQINKEKQYQNEFSIAIHLLGLFFGFDKLSRFYYEHFAPRFFKSTLGIKTKEAEDPQTKEAEKLQSKEEAHLTKKNNSITSESKMEEEPVSDLPVSKEVEVGETIDLEVPIPIPESLESDSTEIIEANSDKPKFNFSAWITDQVKNSEGQKILLKGKSWTKIKEDYITRVSGKITKKEFIKLCKEMIGSKIELKGDELSLNLTLFDKEEE